LPPLLRRCLIVLPDDAGRGFVPHNEANADSFFKRCGLSPATDNRVAAVCGPTPN